MYKNKTRFMDKTGKQKFSWIASWPFVALTWLIRFFFERLAMPTLEWSSYAYRKFGEFIDRHIEVIAPITRIAIAGGCMYPAVYFAAIGQEYSMNWLTSLGIYTLAYGSMGAIAAVFLFPTANDLYGWIITTCIYTSLIDYLEQYINQDLFRGVAVPSMASLASNGLENGVTRKKTMKQRLAKAALATLYYNI